jgi:glycosyltransferase involved in cell wall biosynthesis
MLFSVVIPTHNRLHLLRHAIETVRRQTDAAWELIVFDNCSEYPIGEHVRGLDDPRIRYDRTDAFLPVTDSWNRAIGMARGDYVILLGDDDGLTPYYFARIEKIVRRFQQPEVVYTDFYQFWHAGVAPWEPSEHLIDIKHGFFFVDRPHPFRLSADDAARAVAGSLAFRINFSFNSQAFLYSRPFLERLRAKAPIYRSPFPDYYIANVALALSTSTVVVPEPLAVAGVSKASYGYAMYNDQQAKGDALLNISYSNDPVYDAIEAHLLPGPTYNTNFVLSMEYVARDTCGMLGKTTNFDRYRQLQIVAALQSHCASARQASVWPEVRRRLSAAERRWAAGVRLMLESRKRVPAPVGRRIGARLAALSSMSGFGPMVRHCGLTNFTNVAELYDAFEAGWIG